MKKEEKIISIITNQNKKQLNLHVYYKKEGCS